MTKTANIAKSTCEEIGDQLLKAFDLILDDIKSPKIAKIEEFHKQAISLKAFDLVSISM